MMKNPFTFALSYILAVVMLGLGIGQLHAAHPVDFNKELIIRDLSVVNDPLRTNYVPFDPANPDAGAWSFGRLMENMMVQPSGGGSVSPAALSNFVLSWLQSWEVDQTVNGDLIEARTRIRSQVIDPWLDASGNNVLDMTKAPFRLLSIVNRVDLHNSPDAAGSLEPVHAGEGRFVFGVLNANGGTMLFTVIFEYELVASSQTEIQNWAQRWHALGELDFGEAYNTELRLITDDFTGIGAAPNKVNGSAINQVRTNEIALGAPWELREFNLGPAGLRMLNTTVKQTPRLELNNSDLLAAFINRNEPAILAETHVVPLRALGGHSQSSTDDSSSLTWNAPGINNPVARHKFALNTCSGCHTVETDTGFLHINPRPVNAVAALSGFLNGFIVVNDPVVDGVTHEFDEPQRRIDSLNALLDNNAGTLLQVQSIKRVH